MKCKINVFHYIIFWFLAYTFLYISYIIFIITFVYIKLFSPTFSHAFLWPFGLSLVLAPRISSWATSSTTIPHHTHNYRNTTMTQVDAIVNMKGPITKFQAPRKKDSDIEALVLIGITVVLAIVIAIVFIMMVEFCGGL